MKMLILSTAVKAMISDLGVREMILSFAAKVRIVFTVTWEMILSAEVLAIIF